MASRSKAPGARHPRSPLPRQQTLREKLPEARLATWAELWETVVREKGDALALNLDRKSLILDTFRRIEMAARG